MSKIAISGASTGSATFTIESPATSTNRTLTLPDETGTIVTTGITTGLSASALSTGTLAAARLPAGSVLQVLSTTKTDTFSLTGSTGNFSDITGLSVSITPSSASNKILVIAHTVISSAASGNRAGVRLVRGSTAICIGDANDSVTRSTVGGQQVGAVSEQDSVAFNFLDSPNTTSATTYKIQLCGENGTTYYINRTGSSSTGGDQYSSTSTITVMEIAA
jgi:hypothetical protein